MEEPNHTEPRAVAPRRFRWIRAADDRLPTKWIAGIATALFLAVTAAFGGLATAAEPEIPVLEAGDEHRNEQLAMTVVRAVLIDEFPEAGVYVEPGERVLAVVVDAENLWTQPLPTSAGDSVSEALRLDEVAGAAPDAVARLDDATQSPVLQPGVPARLVVTWAVDAERFAAGDTVALVLSDETLYTGQIVVEGQSWGDPEQAAIVEVTLEDVGAGADS